MNFFKTLATFRNPLKFLILGYLMLLIFEGALRKWFLPGLSNPLLIVRDPLALLIYVLAFSNYQKALVNVYTISITAIATFSFLATMVLGHGNLFVGVFGVRTLMLHFPMVFVIGYALNKEEVVFIGKLLLLMTIPMTLILVAQYGSGQGSWINQAPGGGAGRNLAGALGKFRPSGTFSYITGVVQFYTLAAAFLFSAFFERKYFPMWMIFFISGCFLIAVPISISRTLFLNVIILTSAALYGLQKTGNSSKGIIRFGSIGLIVFVVASQFEIFQSGIETFTARWESSTTDVQGGMQTAIIGRFFESFTKPFSMIWWVNLFGDGIGLGTNAGAGILTGNRAFLMGEGEWERLVFEMGPILGFATIGFRTIFSFKLAFMGHRSLKSKNLLPWLIISSTFLLIVNGQWGQPTTLGFTVFGAGLCLAAMRTKKPMPKRNKKNNLTASINQFTQTHQKVAGDQKPQKPTAKTQPAELPKPPSGSFISRFNLSDDIDDMKNNGKSK